MATSERATAPSLHDVLQSLVNWTVLFRVGEYIFVTLGLFAAIGAFLGGMWASTLLLGQGFPLLDVALLLGGILYMLGKSFLTWRGKGQSEVKALGLGGIVAIICILIHSMTDFNLHIPANMLLFSVVLSLTAVIIIPK